MGISSQDAKRIQFSGTEHSYDGIEVEMFRRRVVAALESHESELGSLSGSSGAADDDLAAAQRIRHQAVALAERMLRDVMGSSSGDIGGMEDWQDAVMLRAAAAEEMEFAREEARRLPAIAAAERDEIRAKYANERRELRSELHGELQASRDAALAEAEDIKGRAAEEANMIVKRAVERAEESQRAAHDEVQRLTRRIAVLHTALADAEGRFRRLAATAANEIGTLAAIADQDVAESVADRPELRLASVDLTDEGLESTDDTESGLPEPDPEAGFYQKRLAGLRDRLEKSGHPPGTL